MYSRLYSRCMDFAKKTKIKPLHLQTVRSLSVPCVYSTVLCVDKNTTPLYNATTVNSRREQFLFIFIYRYTGAVLLVHTYLCSMHFSRQHNPKSDSSQYSTEEYNLCSFIKFKLVSTSIDFQNQKSQQECHNALRRK